MKDEDFQRKRVTPPSATAGDGGEPQAQPAQAAGAERAANSAERGSNSAERGNDSAERGNDSAERGNDSAERGNDSAERGNDSAERGNDSAERGNDSPDRGINWPEPLRSVPDDGLVEVASASLPSLRSAGLSIIGLLTQDERARADRIAQPRGRERFILARGFVRLLLGRLLQCDPRAVPITIEPSGRPILAPSAGAVGLQWSLAHSHEQIVVAWVHAGQAGEIGGLGQVAGVGRVPGVGRVGRVGIDLERLDRPVQPLLLSRRFFHVEEVRRLEALPATGRQAAFLHYWTAKEAVLKAIGKGLAGALSDCVVQWDLGSDEATVHYDEGQGPRQWHVRYDSPAPDYLVAVTADGPHWRYRCREFRPGGSADAPLSATDCSPA